MVYKFAEGTVVPKKTSAQDVGERLALLCEQNGLLEPNELKPKVVVEDARNSKSPLHKLFEWDNTVAAEKYRLEQAGYIIRHIVVTTVERDTPSKPYRAFVSVTSKRKKAGRVYVPVKTAMDDEEYRADLFRIAKQDFLVFREKYAELKELADLFETGKRIFR